MSKKLIAYILFIIAAIILIGLIFKWNFSIWRILDIIFILVLISCGLFLFKKDVFFSFNKKRLFYVALGLLVVVGLFLGALQIKLSFDKKAKQCHYELSNIKENRYQQDDKSYPSQFLGTTYWIPEKHYTYWEIDGMIKNKSSKSQYLDGMVLKIYSKDGNNILISEGYLDVHETMTTDQSLPFQVRAQIDRKNNISISKYFQKDDPVRIDVFPYFLTCE